MYLFLEAKKFAGRLVACKYCDEILEPVGQYKSHMQQKHPEFSTSKLWPCEECLYVAKGMEELRRHTRFHNMQTAVKCPLCPFLGRSYTFVKKHLERKNCTSFPDEKALSDALAVVDKMLLDSGLQHKPQKIEGNDDFDAANKL